MLQVAEASERLFVGSTGLEHRCLRVSVCGRVGDDVRACECVGCYICEHGIRPGIVKVNISADAGRET